MSITGAEVWLVHLPFVRPFVTANGIQRHRKAVILRLEDDSGLEGWGECVADDTPYTSPESSRSAFDALAVDVETLLTWAGDATRPLVAATVDAALADLDSRTRGAPLATQYGASPGPVEVGAVIGDLPLREATIAVEQLVDAGYGRIKLKVRDGDLTTVAAVRAALPDAPLAIDANGSMDPERLHHAALDRLELLFVEQPFGPKALKAHARLRSQSTTPICLDESVRSDAELDQVIAREAADIVAIKAGPLGGVSTALTVAESARDAGLRVLVGGMLETGIGRGHALAFARSQLATEPADLPGTANYLAADLTPRWDAERGTITVPDVPGLGRSVDRDSLNRFSVDHHSTGRGSP